jgi:hypothetical protein
MDHDRTRWTDVWRVALALTGDEARAGAVLAGVVARARSLDPLGETRLWRAVVAAAGDPDAPGGWAPPGDDAVRAWRALGALPRPLRAAWALREVGGVPDGNVGVIVADPSGASALERADATLRDALGDRTGPATAALREAIVSASGSASLADAEAAAAAARARRRRLTALQLAALLACFGMMIYVLIDLLGWDEARDAERREAERLSNPIPDEPTP